VILVITMLIRVGHTLMQIREKLREKSGKIEGIPSIMRSYRQCEMITSRFLQGEKQMRIMIMIVMRRMRIKRIRSK